MQNVPSEMCSAWQERWDHYASPACWMKCTQLDPTLPPSMPPFELMFSSKPRTSLDMLVPLVDGSEQSGGLNVLFAQC